MKTKLLLIAITLLLATNMVNAQNRNKHKENKFVYMTSVGFSTGVGYLNYNDDKLSLKNKYPVFQVHQLLAYQFGDYFFAGIGAGADIWKGTAFIPIYANCSVNFMKTRLSPHWYCNLGYAFKWYVETTPDVMTRVILGSVAGPQAESGIGIKLKLNEKVALIITANYKLQMSDIKYSIIEPGEVDFSRYATNRSEIMLYHYIGARFAVYY